RGLAREARGAGHGAPAGRRTAEDSASLRSVRAVRRPQEIPDGRQYRAGRHACAPGHLPDRPAGPPAVRRPADGRVHRRRDRQARSGVVSAREKTFEIVRPDEVVSPRAWRTLAWTGLAVFMAILDGTVLFVAFPSIGKSFPSVSPADLSWILNAYTIVYGA